jgi:hypothetical protein
MACISENVSESPEFKKLVSKIGLSETVRDYLENDRVRSLEEIMETKPDLFKTKVVKETAEVVKKQDTSNIMSLYQGYNGVVDDREFNYFTIDKQEAQNYGTTVRNVSLDTNGFLKAFDNTVLYRDEEKSFTEFTGKTFDILDNSPQGLEIQNEFFRFLKAKGYGGIDLTGWSDSQYVVSFYPVKSVTPEVIDIISLDSEFKNDPEITTDDFRC